MYFPLRCFSISHLLLGSGSYDGRRAERKAHAADSARRRRPESLRRSPCARRARRACSTAGSASALLAASREHVAEQRRACRREDRGSPSPRPAPTALRTSSSAPLGVAAPRDVRARARLHRTCGTTSVSAAVCSRDLDEVLRLAVVALQRQDVREARRPASSGPHARPSPRAWSSPVRSSRSAARRDRLRGSRSGLRRSRGLPAGTGGRTPRRPRPTRRTGCVPRRSGPPSREGRRASSPSPASKVGAPGSRRAGREHLRTASGTGVGP